MKIIQNQALKFFWSSSSPLQRDFDACRAIVHLFSARFFFQILHTLISCLNTPRSHAIDKSPQI